jgi:uncharacterized protein (DUF1684 family)
MRITLLFLLVVNSCFAQFLSEVQLDSLRQEHEESLLNPKTTILDSTEMHSFQGLDYFDFDARFQIKARFEKDKGRRFKMPTTTERQPVYRRYGYVYFMVDQQEHRLTVFQNMELRKNSEYENYLFIPFRDATAGVTTYGGGRYLDTTIPEENHMYLDFNLSYNPYCAYSHHFSCPIPPEENQIKVSINAGEKIPLVR